MELRGVRVHNLKNLNLDIPLDRVVVLSGVSGSGKSSLAFETILAEGQRRYIESFSIAARQRLERVERPDADRIAHVPVAIAIRNDRSGRVRFDARSTVAILSELFDGIRLLFARAGQIVCLDCGHEVRADSATDVVHAITACAPGTRCQLGFIASEPSETDPCSTWLARGYSRAIWGNSSHHLSAKPAWPIADDVWIVVDRIVVGAVADARLLESAETALRDGAGHCWLLIEAQDSNSGKSRAIDGRNWELRKFSRSLQCNFCGRQYLPAEPRLFSYLSSGACAVCRGTGCAPKAESPGDVCPACQATRLRDEARAVRIGDISIDDIYLRSVLDVLKLVKELPSQMPTSICRQTERIREDLSHRLNAVCELGLDYLTLNRSSETLSGGEIRRLMIAATIGARTSGTLVVIDEPSAGLSASELPQVVDALRRVQRLRNSVIAVDHAPLIVAAADHVIELGPGAGPQGGDIVFQGPPFQRTAVSSGQDASSGTSVVKPVIEQTQRNQATRRSSSLEKGNKTLSLNNIRPICQPEILSPGAETSKDFLRVRRADFRCKNLVSSCFEFPLNRLCVVSGASGTGKTTLLTGILFPAISRQLGIACPLPPIADCDLLCGEGLVDIVLVDQSPLTRSPRSNPATWLEIFDEIRQTFAATVEAKQRGYTPRHFSFNSATGGRCRICQGTGMLKHDMEFLPDVTLACPECGGTRYARETLDVKYRGRSIADVLAMSVGEAASFFRSQPRIQNRFQMLKQIGLDYLVLGQPSETLSGGEAQRLKLAARIAAPNRGPCLFLCDEATNGLHPTDVGRLVATLRELIANGHSLILADNSPELISAADYVFELHR